MWTQQYMQLWYLDGPNADAMALEYSLLLLFNSWFVNVFAWEDTYNGVSGMFVAWSSARSTRHQEATRRMPIGDVDPHWVEYDLYFHPNAFLGAFQGASRQPRISRPPRRLSRTSMPELAPELPAGGWATVFPHSPRVIA